VDSITYSKRIILSLATIMVIAVGSSDVLAAEPVNTSMRLSNEAVTRPKRDQIITPNLETKLTSRPNTEIKVWVFFTDKAVFDKSGFAQAAASVTLTDRAQRRRAKMDKNMVVFADLAVPNHYVEAIENLGAKHRRSSRWLNAATFELPARLLEPISDLPFVAEIRPMAFYQHIPEPEGDSRDDRFDQALAEPHALDYGESIYQLEQINVPAVHDLGYTGLGVTLTIMDTGFRKTHDAIIAHLAENRLLAEYDFVYNDSNTDYDDGDWASETSHGTRVWSVAAGYADGYLYGPAYQANFILCKTEDIRSETPIEEDNWVAALEFADSVGTDVISTSLGYITYDDPANSYTYEDIDGQTAIISIAASTCDGLGIVMVNSAGNSGGLGAGSITPPADAHDILAVGAVDGSGTIAGFSSLGPTYDGRIKPEVCARGVATLCAHQSDDNTYANYYGTSFSAPLVAGAACLVIEAHPDWTPYQVREALKASGSNTANPDNTYGWGIINTYNAIQYDPGCCVGIVGNVNGVGGEEPTISDISALIDYLFINRTPVDCLPEADINQSGETFPTETDLSIGDVAVLIDYLFITGPSLGLPNCM